MNNAIISDTSCLIALDRIGKLELLQKLFNTIITTPEVKYEFGKDLPTWILIREVNNNNKKKELQSIVDLGEASALALAIETPQSLLIIDERKGRKLAKDLNIKIIGTLRLILMAKQKGFLSSVTETVSELRKANFHLDRKIVNRILKDACE